jgi:phage tail-like protein
MRTDPLLGYNFSITLVDSSSLLSFGASLLAKQAVGGFSECSGLDTTMEIEDYREGGNNGLVRKFPTRITWANIRLRRGLTTSTVLWDWRREYIDGVGKRRDGVIILLNDARKPVRAWRFSRGLPLKWAGPSLNAIQNQVAIEELEIAHEGLKAISASVAGSVFG